MHILIAYLLFICSCERVFTKDYDNYQLVQIYPTHETHAAILKDLHNDIEVDFWKESNHSEMDILISPIRFGFLVEQFRLLGLRFKILNNNIQRDIDDEKTRLSEYLLNKGNTFNYDNFNTIADINAEMEAVAARCPDGVLCSTNVIGQTLEKRHIKGITIKKPSTGRQSIYIDATTHAREWLSTATIMKILKHLVDDYNTDSQVKQLVDKYDFHIYPIINQDGYNYTWIPDGDRLWRKNRRINYNSNGTVSSCRGVDLNRNFDQKWSNAGSSSNLCSNTYRGCEPASELETQAVQNYILANPNIKFLVSLHTYGQDWLIPWGSYADGTKTCNYSDDNDEMMVVANAAADAVEATYNTKWSRGNLCATLYPASGITVDFAKDKGGIKYTVTPELRGTSFVVPPDQIDPSFNEIWNGITVAIKTIENQS